MAKTTKLATKLDGFDADAVLYLPRKTIHPDPDQPRVHPDAELQASIDAQGIIQAITVRPHPELENEWILVDGERRWLGAAHLKTIPCRIRLDLEDPAERLITQLTANTGKPLSPIEQAIAFKKILDDDPKASQAELAKRLGIPRSTIGDRIRLMELDQAWLDLIQSGKLQVSHAPILSVFSPVPSEYQKKAAKILIEDYRAKRYLAGDGSIPVDELRRLLLVAFRDFIKETSRTPGYKGPTIEIKSEYSLSKIKYAADITLWRPCFRQWEKKGRKASRTLYSGHGGGGRYVPPVEKALAAIKAAGVEIPERVPKDRQEPLRAGETAIYSERGWSEGLHPKVLLEKLDPATLIYLKGFGGDRIVTTDAAAVTAAREAYQKHAVEKSRKLLAPLRDKLTADVLAQYPVAGAGCEHLLAAINPSRGAPKVVALALGLAIEGSTDTVDNYVHDDDETSSPILTDRSSSNAEKLLSALAAVAALDLKVPDGWRVEEAISSGISDVPFKLADPPKSKKQQKREARAAGEQVGDPARVKNVDVGVMRAAVEAGVEEEELVEA